jgi:hypothetical protein
MIGCQVKTRTLCINKCVKGFLEIHTVANIDGAWEIDLADLISLSRYNDKYKYLLNVIDILHVMPGACLKDRQNYNSGFNNNISKYKANYHTIK